jgi:hypothetical protein
MLGRSRRLHHLLLFVGVITIALGVLAMHQLAVSHGPAAPIPSSWHKAGHSDEAGASGHNHQLAATPLSTGTEAPTLAGVFGGDSCWPDCDTENDQSVASCLLALTLLVLRWRLTMPQQRLLPDASMTGGGPCPSLNCRFGVPDGFG